MDPGVKTEMLADPAKEAAGSWFTNTSVSEKECRPFVGVINELFKHAAT